MSGDKIKAWEKEGEEIKGKERGRKREETCKKRKGEKGKDGNKPRKPRKVLKQICVEEKK